MTHFNHLSLAEIDELERLIRERRDDGRLRQGKVPRFRVLAERRHPPIYEPRDAA